MSSAQTILSLAQEQPAVTTAEVATMLDVSRQYAQRKLRELVDSGQLVKIGSTRSAVYMLPEKANKPEWKIDKRLHNTNLTEHTVLETIIQDARFRQTLSENVQSIFNYAFSEMLNNAIEHSESEYIRVIVMKQQNTLVFQVHDRGIGVFRNIRTQRQLRSDLEAIQDLLKGKTTTQPQAHSGEGIFFTSKVADYFTLESYGTSLTIDNTVDDIAINTVKPARKGTIVTFRIAAQSHTHLLQVFSQYQTDPAEPAFDKTAINIELYTMGTVHVSRSQARRVLAHVEQFRTVILDFKNVPTIGQAFADEIFRVWKQQHPDISITPINMNETVRFWVERVGQ